MQKRRPLSMERSWWSYVRIAWRRSQKGVNNVIYLFLSNAAKHASMLHLKSKFSANDSFPCCTRPCVWNKSGKWLRSFAHWKSSRDFGAWYGGSGMVIWCAFAEGNFKWELCPRCSGQMERERTDWFINNNKTDKN